MHYWTPAESTALKAEYRPDKGVILQLAARFGVTAGAVRSKARKLGMARARGVWTDADDAKLVDLAASLPTREVARALRRSEMSTLRRLRDLGRSTKVRDWFTGEDVACILGVDRRWVYSRIKAGVLPAIEHFGHDKIKAHHVSREALRKFVVGHPMELQGLRPDMVAFIDLLAGNA